GRPPLLVNPKASPQARPWPSPPVLASNRFREHARAFRTAVTPHEHMKTFKNFIGGDWVPPIGGEYFENRNPADITDSIGRFPLSGAADVDRAVASAQRGFEIWRATPAPARGDTLRRVGDILTKRKDEIADL